MKKIVAYQIDTELFFEELLVKKNEQNGLFCIYIWYKCNNYFVTTFVSTNFFVFEKKKPYLIVWLLEFLVI